MQLSARHQAEVLPFGRKLLQRRGPAAGPAAIGRSDAAAAEGELRALGGEWEREEAVSIRPGRSYRDRHVLLRRKRHVFEDLLHSLGRMNAIEVEGKRIEELQRLVVLENLALVQPSAGL